MESQGDYDALSQSKEDKTLLVNHFMEDSSEDKRQERQYPQESMRMKCKLEYENAS